MSEEPILNRIKHEVWVTEREYMEWGVDSRIWEIIEKDHSRARVKIRRIKNDGDGTST